MTGPAGPISSSRGSAVLVDDLLAKCQFPPPDPDVTAAAPVALGVSGGPDSLALLVLAVRAGLEVVAIHVDHGLRPGSEADAEVVAGAAARYGARFETRSVTIASGPDLEARARLARYRVLPPDVLTGHTMDDQAETVLLALLRGAALDGLSGMRSVPADPNATPRTGGRGRPGRPLLGLRRTETAALCASEGLVPVRDPSNANPRFRRNRVRAELVPMMSAIAARDVVPVLARQAQVLAADAEFLEELSADIDPTDAKLLGAAPLPLARRAVRRWLRGPSGFPDEEHHPPSAAEVARVLAVASGRAQACELAGGRRVQRRTGRLMVAPGPGASTVGRS
jgi:tRNA(Ile)-lysidine synthase